MLGIIVFCLSMVAAAEAAQPESSSTQILQAAVQTMQAARYAALITLDDQGQPRARTVDPFPVGADIGEPGVEIWVATRPVTRKVAQIRQHSQVTLYYFDASTRSYVTIMGTARLVNDSAVKRAKRREEDSDRLYPDFPDDYLLIAISPTWLEAIVPGFRGDKQTWKPEVVRFGQ